MQKRRKVLLQTLVGLLIVLSVAVVSTTAPRPGDQPSYKGLNLAQWLDIVARHRINGYAPAISSRAHQPAKDATPEQVHEAEEAVRAIGTNGLPFLLAWINPRPNPLKIFYRGVLNPLPLPEHTRGFLWGIPGTTPEHLSDFAVQGFRLLNTNALPAVADLSKLANDTNHPWTQILAAKALFSVTNGHSQ